MSYLAGASTPQIHATAQTDAEDVLRGPVHQVQIEVVLQLRSIQNLEGYPRDLAGGFARGTKELLRLRRYRGQAEW